MSRRERLRQSALDEIKTIARRHMAENGTAGVSLSAIARDMEISQPALYRYYASRDDLITALIVDAYNDLADMLEHTPLDLPANAHADRLMAVLLAYRTWALTHTVDFTLIYGSPIPGYHAPREVTLPPAQRTFAVILGILSQAHAVGALKPLEEHLHLPAGLAPLLPTLEGGLDESVNPAVLYIGLVGWYHIHGMIMLEIYDHNTTLLSDMDLFYRHEVASLLRSMGLYPGLEKTQ